MSRYLVAVMLVTNVYGAERYVPGTYETIQQAIFAANPGDHVVIAPGVYSGTNNWNLDPMGKAITIRSTDPTNTSIVTSTIIDCQGTTNFGIRFRSNETSATVLEGITIQHTQSRPISCSDDPVIRDCIIRQSSYCSFSDSPLIERCIFDSNTSEYGAVYVTSGTPAFRDCVFLSNEGTGSSSGGAIRINSNAFTTLDRCLFERNHAQQGGAINLSGGLEMYNCLLDDNSADRGGALYHTSGLLTLANCTMVNNVAALYGGAMYTSYYNLDNQISNSIIRLNEAPNGPQLGIYSAFLNVYNSNVQGGQTEADVSSGGFLNYTIDNIDADPMFMGVDDYHLRANSPCIDSGDNDVLPLSVTTDLDGSPRFQDDTGMPDTGFGDPPIVDMGAYEFGGTSTLDDEDNDGVPDSNDNCPGTIPTMEVDTFGCPPRIKGDIDRDGDVDQDDFAILQLCSSGPMVPASLECYE